MVSKKPSLRDFSTSMRSISCFLASMASDIMVLTLLESWPARGFCSAGTSLSPRRISVSFPFLPRYSTSSSLSFSRLFIFLRDSRASSCNVFNCFSIVLFCSSANLLTFWEFFNGLYDL